jgi:hypothetical protein|tara:strand:+ start:156 stop:527 length:372 start_codon:yes stop_codon:yes gene_type:complete
MRIRVPWEEVMRKPAWPSHWSWVVGAAAVVVVAGVGVIVTVSGGGVIVIVSGGSVIVIVSGGGVIVIVSGGAVVPPLQAVKIGTVANSPTTIMPIIGLTMRLFNPSIFNNNPSFLKLGDIDIH